MDPNKNFLMIMLSIGIVIYLIRLVLGNIRAKATSGDDEAKKNPTPESFERTQTIRTSLIYLAVYGLFIVLTLAKIESIAPGSVTSKPFLVGALAIVGMVLALIFTWVKDAFEKRSALPKRFSAEVKNNFQADTKTATAPNAPAWLGKIQEHKAIQATSWASYHVKPAAVGTITFILSYCIAPTMVTTLEVLVSTWVPAVWIAEHQAIAEKNDELKDAVRTISKANSDASNQIENLKDSVGVIDMKRVMYFGQSQLIDQQNVNIGCLTLGLSSKDTKVALDNLGKDVSRLLPVASKSMAVDANSKTLATDLTKAGWANISTTPNVGQTQSFKLMAERINKDMESSTTTSSIACNANTITDIVNKGLATITALALESNKQIDTLSAKVSKTKSYSVQNVYATTLKSTILANWVLMLLLTPFIQLLTHSLRYGSANSLANKLVGLGGLTGCIIDIDSDKPLLVIPTTNNGQNILPIMRHLLGVLMNHGDLSRIEPLSAELTTKFNQRFSEASCQVFSLSPNALIRLQVRQFPYDKSNNSNHASAPEMDNVADATAAG